MQSISTPARSRTFARIAGYAAATGAAWYALGGATDANSLTPLFGWQRLIVVQVVMTLPLGIFAALVLQKCVPVAWRRSLALAGSAAGLAATLLVANDRAAHRSRRGERGPELVAASADACHTLRSGRIALVRGDRSDCRGEILRSARGNEETIASHGLVGNCRTWCGDRIAGRLCRGFDSQANGRGKRLARAATASWRQSA